MIIIGLIIGLVMGLTGAGGALVGIPLFIHFLEMSLKEASIYSLMAVVIASLSNFVFQRKSANIILAIQFTLFSFVGSFVSNPYKELIPDFWIIIMLSLISLYSLYSVWFSSKKNHEVKNIKRPHLLITAIVGLLLGVLTTYTGLGGGVLMLPILISVYKEPEKNAVATSLIVVGLSSLFSFIIQIVKSNDFNPYYELGYLIFGIMTASYIIKIILAKSSDKISSYVRKVTFSFVVALALLKFFHITIN